MRRPTQHPPDSCGLPHGAQRRRLPADLTSPGVSLPTAFGRYVVPGVDCCEVVPGLACSEVVPGLACSEVVPASPVPRSSRPCLLRGRPGLARSEVVPASPVARSSPASPVPRSTPASPVPRSTPASPVASSSRPPLLRARPGLPCCEVVPASPVARSSRPRPLRGRPGLACYGADDDSAPIVSRDEQGMVRTVDARRPTLTAAVDRFTDMRRSL